MTNEIFNAEEITELSEKTTEEVLSAPDTENVPDVENTDIPSTEEEPVEVIPSANKDEISSNSEEYLNSLIREERISNEYEEFKSLFPGVSVSALPDSVLSSVRGGVPLSAAYALYERRKAVSESIASDINQKNRELSFAVKNGSAEAYFSPSEVRQMSAAEVKANYSKIIDSMSHWN